MTQKELTKEKIKELNEIKEQVKRPEIETKNVPLIRNSYPANKKIINQYKIAIPKKFVDFLEINEKDYNAKVILDKETNKLTIEIEKNEKK